MSTTATNGFFIAVTCLIILVAIIGCTDTTPFMASPLNVNLSENIERRIEDVPAVDIERPTEPKRWHIDDVALAKAMREANGFAILAIKEKGSARALETGIRAKISSSTIRGALKMLEGRGVNIVDYYENIGAALIESDPEIVVKIKNHPLVDYIVPQHRKATLASGAASMFSQTRPWGAELIAAPMAWEFPATGNGASLMIIDSGHDQGHEDLPYVPLSNCGGSYSGCSDPSQLGHGSHVLGIATARNNTRGVIGVAYGLQGSDVYVWGACDSSGCSPSQVVAGLNAAVSWGVDVVSMSLSGDDDVDWSNAVAQAWQADIVLVASAGNTYNGAGGTVVYPAGYSHVIGVSGVQPNKQFADWSPCSNFLGTRTSNFGTHVELSAPFWALSTTPGDTYSDEGQGYCGTSMAAPYVAGVAAIVRGEFPGWDNQKVRQHLRNAEDLGAPGIDDYYGYGLVNAFSAILGTYTTQIDVTGPGIVTQTDDYMMISQGGTYTFTATVSGMAGAPDSYQWEIRRPALGEQDYQPLTGANPANIQISGCDGNVDIRLKVYDSNEAYNQRDMFVENFANC